MAKKRSSALAGRLLVRALAVVLALAACGESTTAAGDENEGAAVQQTAPAQGEPAGLGDINKLLAKIKAEYPEAHILKVELLSGEPDSGQDWVYEVKLFPPDGRILRLVYDARSLTLLENAPGCGRGRGLGPCHRHLRFRRGWHGGMGD